MVLPRIDPRDKNDRINVLVVDDELPARQRLTDLLRAQTWVDAVLEAEDGLKAVAMIEGHRPDLVFLDVQMPELDGLGVMQAVGPHAMPLTIFVTAYDQHALWAFEANALDYLLKPFSDERFEAAMERARSRFDERSLQEFGRRLASMIAASNGQPGAGQSRPWLDRLVVKFGGATRLIRVVEVEWIEAAGVYVTLHLRGSSVPQTPGLQTSATQAAGREILYRSSLSELAERLDPAQFVRVHRSTIVNLESIQQLEPISHGEFEVVLKSGARTKISRSYRAQLEARLGQSL